jgi:hypothetical protein
VDSEIGAANRCHLRDDVHVVHTRGDQLKLFVVISLGQVYLPRVFREKLNYSGSVALHVEALLLLPSSHNLGENCDHGIYFNLYSCQDLLLKLVSIDKHGHFLDLRSCFGVRLELDHVSLKVDLTLGVRVRNYSSNSWEIELSEGWDLNDNMGVLRLVEPESMVDRSARWLDLNIHNKIRSSV